MVEQGIRPGARAAIARDKVEGRRVVMATASYRFYAREIADRLGFDDCIGTNSVLGLDDRVRARIDGENCYGPAKLRMIEDWLGKSGLQVEPRNPAALAEARESVGAGDVVVGAAAARALVRDRSAS